MADEKKKNEAVGADDGFEALSTGGDDFDTFIDAEDLKVGATVHGIITGAKLLPDDQRGGYRAVYAVSLKAPLGAHAANASVGLGERTKLRVLRRVTIGTEVKVKVLGKQKLKGGKTMHTFDVRVKPNRVAGAKTVETVLNEAWKASGASAPWEQASGGGDNDAAF